MKNLFGYLFIASLLLFASCQKEEQDDITVESDNVFVEPDFIEKDGSAGLMGEELDGEEEAPAFQSKSYGQSSYTLLTPSGLKRGDVAELACDEATTFPLLVGSRKKRVGRVFVSNDAENLYITIKTNQYQLMKKVYFYIGAKEDIPFYSNGFPKLRDFNYKAFPTKHNGDRRATYIIPLSSIDLDCFEIVAYSKIYDEQSKCYYSSFAYPKRLDQHYWYSNNRKCIYYGDWVRSFEFCKQTCEVEVECSQVYGFHAECGFCENDTLYTFLAYTFIEGRGAAGVEIELIDNVNGCDISNGTDVGHINISSASDTKLAITYEAAAGYQLCDVNLSYGTSETALINTYVQQLDSATTTHSFEIDKLEGANIFFDIQANVAPSN